MTWSSEPRRPRRIVVAGAGHVGRALARELIVHGLRDDAPFSLAVLATEARRDATAFLLDELRDVSNPALADAECTTIAARAFDGCDIAVVTASGPLVGGGSRRELFTVNAPRVASLASTAMREGRQDARVAIVSNPVNALVGHVVRVEGCDPDRVSGVVSIDLARARSLLARALPDPAVPSLRTEVWGDHASSVAVALPDLVVPGDVLATVDRLLTRRGPELLATHGRTAVDSVAVAAKGHLAEWMLGSDRSHPTVAAVWHAHAVDALGAVPFTMPVLSDGDRWVPVHDRLPADPRIAAAMRVAREEIEQTWQGLEHERTGVEP